MNKLRGTVVLEDEPKFAAQDGSRRAYCLLVLTIVYTLNYFDRSIVNVLLDPIKADLHLTDTSLGFIAGLGFALLYTLLGVPFSILADMGSRKIVIAFGVFAWSLMTAAGGFAHSAMQLVIARTGVGLGEAAGTAPTHALLSDYYSKDERPRALGILNLGLPGGIFLGLFVGGWAGQMFGWRTALLLGGLPGLIVASLFVLTVREPVRTKGADVGHAMDFVSIGATLRFLTQQRSYVYSVTASLFSGFGLNAIIVWTPSFFRRIHHLSSAEIGLWVGAVLGIAGVLGVFGGGALVTRFGVGEDRLKAAAPAGACILATPFLVAMLFVSSKTLALGCVGIGTLLSYSIVGPVFSIYQCVARPRMRSVAAAIHNVAGTLGGLGLGPVLIGMVSDSIAPTYGSDAIRYALLLPILAFLPAGLLYLLSTKTIREDILRADASMA